MNERPTPETDLIEQGMFGSDPKLIADFARRLERERDEAREAAEKAKAFKRVLKDDNAKLRRELAAERALADWLGHSIKRLRNMSPPIYAHAMDDLNAGKEARK